MTDPRELLPKEPGAVITLEQVQLPHATVQAFVRRGAGRTWACHFRADGNQIWGFGDDQAAALADLRESILDADAFDRNEIVDEWEQPGH